MRVFASIPKLTVTPKGEKEKEIYVLSIASDLAGVKNRPPSLGAANETLDRIAPKIPAAMKYFVVSASNLFHGVRENQPLSLSGSGIILYPPIDPKGMLALHVVVVESDGGKRNAARVLAELFSIESIRTALRNFPQRAGVKIAPGLLTATFGAITAILPEILKRNGDDILFEHGHSGFDFDDYGMAPDGSDYELGNDRAGFHLRIRVIKGR